MRISKKAIVTVEYKWREIERAAKKCFPKAFYTAELNTWKGKRVLSVCEGDREREMKR